MIILRNPKTGERVVIDEESRDGYPGWRIIEKGVSRPRGHSERLKGRWRIDKAKSRPPTVQGLQEELEAMRERLAKLEEHLDGRS